MSDFIDILTYTQFIGDIAKCMKLALNSGNREKTLVKDIGRALSSFPDISVKFDGFMYYSLAELKLTGDVGYYTISADLKFDYNNTPNISAPSR